jgi:DNA repair protein RecN (Recombination protein N)
LISRFYLKDYLSFEEVDLEFEKGLIVFTGPSGAGKSILMNAFLALFGLTEAKAALSETLLDNRVQNEAYGIEKDDDIIIKEIKKEKIRYFLNNQTVSKKNLNEFSKTLVKHLHLKDTSDFESVKLIAFLDEIASKQNKKFDAIKDSFMTVYQTLNSIQKELQKIYDDESKLEELKEYAKYEIEKIEAIDPKEGEYEELNEIKKTLSKKDKIEEAITLAKPIFEYSSHVSKTLELLDKPSAFFDESMNELTNIFESFSDSLYELEELDIENVLDRIEKLSSLQKRFGSITEALKYKMQKKEELETYENISFEKAQLEKKQQQLQEESDTLANALSQERQKSAKILEKSINEYLKYLYLSNATIALVDKSLDSTGKDDIVFELNGVNLDTISSGEFNRLRLALLTSMSHYQIEDDGILFLDEIDANLSGKESDAIAMVLKELAKSYQIFAISHQSQLTSSANQHFLVDKKNGKSFVKVLNDKQRVEEVSRMISGENITQEAVQFAKNLFDSK